MHEGCVMVSICSYKGPIIGRSISNFGDCGVEYRPGIAVLEGDACIPNSAGIENWRAEVETGVDMGNWSKISKLC